MITFEYLTKVVEEARRSGDSLNGATLSKDGVCSSKSPEPTWFDELKTARKIDKKYRKIAELREAK